MQQRLEDTLVKSNVLPLHASSLLSKKLTWNQVFTLISSSKSLMELFWGCTFDEALNAMSFVSKLIKQHIRTDVVAGKIKRTVEDCEPFSSDDANDTDSGGFYFGVPSQCVPLPSFRDNLPEDIDPELVLPAPTPVDALSLCDWNIHPDIINKLPKPFIVPGTLVVKKFAVQLSKPHELIGADGYIHVKQLTMASDDTPNISMDMRRERSVADGSKLDDHQWLLLCADDTTAFWIPKVGVQALDLSGNLVMISNHTPEQHIETCNKLGIQYVDGSISVIVPVERALGMDLWKSVEDPVSTKKPIPTSTIGDFGRRITVTDKFIRESLPPIIFTAKSTNVSTFKLYEWQITLAFIFLLVAAWVMAVLNAPK